jgi:hypothetical protein
MMAIAIHSPQEVTRLLCFGIASSMCYLPQQGQFDVMQVSL